jgi:ferric-dicitrate binding protein FerR (iron transport regulator)
MMDLAKIRIKPAWTKSKDDIWGELFEFLDEQSDKQTISKRIPLRGNTTDLFNSQRFVRRIPLWSYVAASLFIPILLFCHFYTITEITARGEQAVVQLPDRSTVTLNAESKLSYKPFVWMIARTDGMEGHTYLPIAQINKRKVNLEGEAFFEVKPGSRFSVQTGENRVNVLGTTFNVYARGEIYRVNCLSGRVEVQSGQETVVLDPDMQATLREGKLYVNSDVTPFVATGWLQDMFVFEGTPLREVVAEIERRYNIHVTPDYDSNLLYTGNFSKTDNPEEILEVIGKAFGIIFSQK